MPKFVLIARDVEDSAELRHRNHDAHVRYIASLDARGFIDFAGPIRSPDDSRSVGAVIVFEASDLEQARSIVDRDPYVSAGVFATVDLFPIRRAFPRSA